MGASGRGGSGEVACRAVACGMECEVGVSGSVDWVR